MARPMKTTITQPVLTDKSQILTWKLTYSHHSGHLNTLITETVQCKDRNDCVDTLSLVRTQIESKGREMFSAKCSKGSTVERLFAPKRR